MCAVLVVVKIDYGLGMGVEIKLENSFKGIFIIQKFKLCLV